jgi:hypothetical protein
MSLIIQNKHWKQLPLKSSPIPNIPKEIILWHDTQYMYKTVTLLSMICKRTFHIFSICCRACNHHLQRIHAHFHWETCGFGIHMGPHNQCRALLIWTQRVTFREQKTKAQILLHSKRNMSSSPHHAYRKSKCFFYSYICKHFVLKLFNSCSEGWLVQQCQNIYKQQN